MDRYPRLNPDLAPFWHAFMTLSKTRDNSGFGVGRIKLSEILAFCRLYKIHSVDYRDLLVRRMQAMDDKFIEVVTETKKSKEKK